VERASSFGFSALALCVGKNQKCLTERWLFTMTHNLFIQAIKLSQAIQMYLLERVLSCFIKYLHSKPNYLIQIENLKANNSELSILY